MPHRFDRQFLLFVGFIGAGAIGVVYFDPKWMLLAFAPFVVATVARSLLEVAVRRDAPGLARVARVLGVFVDRSALAGSLLGSGVRRAHAAPVDALLAEYADAAGPDAINGRLNAQIWNGDYRGALATWRRSRRALRGTNPLYEALIRVNLAEAAYNLGHWKRARQLMDALLARNDWRHPLARWVEVGAEAQRAWIAAHEREIERGRELTRGFDPVGFPRDYLAELAFTGAAVELAAGNAAGAEAHLAEARKVLVRASSRRNLLFLEARVAALRGDLDSAIAKCREASEHPYRGQGGDGLLLWGELHAQRGEVDEARRAWALAVERDPQSESARIARARLASQPPRSSDSSSVPMST